nr:hypothetical protein [uncultured Capnocytophaga sp.]
MKVFDELKKAEINNKDIEQLEKFYGEERFIRGRDGFIAVEDEDFEGMQDFFNDYTLFNDLRVILTDENSNYWCVFVAGARKGMVCHLDHEFQDQQQPRFKSISRLLEVIEQHEEAYDFYELKELPENVFDFPSRTLEDFEGRKEIIEQLYQEIDNLDTEDESYDQSRSSRIYSIIVLSIASEVETHIKPFLTDEDDYVREFAETAMKFWRGKLETF